MTARNIPATRKATAAQRRSANTPATPAKPETKVETVTTTEEQAKPEAGAKHPYAYLLEKDPSTLHTNYRTWLESQLGEKLSDRDLKMIQVVAVTRMAFQRSEANQKELQSRKQAWAKQQTEKKAAAAAKKVEQLKKLAAEQGLDLKKLLSA